MVLGAGPAILGRSLGRARDAPVLALTFHYCRFNQPTCVDIG